MLSTEEAAVELGVSPSRIRQLALAGKLRATRYGDRYRGYWKIDPDDIEKYRKVRRGPGRPRK